MSQGGLPGVNRSADLDTTRANPFLVLPENRLAYTAAMNWGTGSENIGPVYVYGPSGIGKSHLVAAALERASAEIPGLVTRQFTASTFSADLTDAIAQGAVRKFQKAYRDLDVVAIEDLHALERRTESQQQLLALIDYWTSHGIRMFLTARKAPGELEGFTPKLISRFHAAVNVPLRSLSPESRHRILASSAQVRGLMLSEEVLDLLARETSGSPRELIGLIVRLEAFARQSRARIDLPYIRKFLQADPPLPKITLTEIVRATAQHFGIPISHMRSNRRLQTCVVPRQCAMFLARELTREHLAKIGQFFSGRDHSTVVRACQRVELLLPEDPELRLHLAQIRKALGAESL